ncbi:MAG: hypothetical protein ACTSX9_06755 [Candidatus Njordarchaeales archaeon]
MKNKHLEESRTEEIIKKILQDSPYDLVTVYEIANYLVKHGINKKEALRIFFDKLFSHIGVKCLDLPPEYIRDFHNRLKRTVYYDDWMKMPEKKKLAVTVCHLAECPEGRERKNPDFVLVSFKDGTKILLGEYRKLVLEAFEYFKKLELARYELMGFFWKIRGYHFEKAAILANIVGCIMDMIDFTRPLITEQVVSNMKHLGTYEIWRKIAEYYNVYTSTPGIIIRIEYIDEENNWIDYNAIKKKFKITS